MSKTHKVLMVACSLIGIGAIVAIFAFGASVNTVFLALMVLICPLSHILMMRFMGHDHGEHTESHHSSGQTSTLKKDMSN